MPDNNGGVGWQGGVPTHMIRVPTSVWISIHYPGIICVVFKIQLQIIYRKTHVNISEAFHIEYSSAILTPFYDSWTLK